MNSELTQFLTHPAGLICIALAVVALIAMPRMKGLPLALLIFGIVIAGVIGYAQVHS